MEQTFGILSFFVTFFLIGIWHGRTSEYVFFGFLQGGGVAINKAWQVFLAKRLGRKPYREMAARPFYAAIARGLTFTWFAISLIWFWASWSQVGTAFFGAGPGAWIFAIGILWISAAVTLASWEWTRSKALDVRTGGQPWVTHPYTRTVFTTLLALTAFLIVAVLSQPAPGIVYRTF